MSLPKIASITLGKEVGKEGCEQLHLRERPYAQENGGFQTNHF
jgi:hypothetical protein